ncbi:hypothetical protein Esi_0121_0067 [Ectocarpus siliculosus]|uniref:Uncharacterized protein n=1 Tax=Ectocarpus siliculosus TaxID=2880 RepID=D8LDQ7_ECTSI|nr:hypothetical protein Esi_0121_0067 [Ectocarpus siliculosus]|eukprot:CBN78464.1 hypothetical protein Esi_0121_0067 [Ectocarpus siliculosus]
MGLVSGGASMGGDNGGDASMGQAAAAGLDALYAEDVDMGEAMPWSFAPDSNGFAGGAASNAPSAQDLSAPATASRSTPTGPVASLVLSAPAAAAGATPATAESNDAASSNTGASASSQSSATAPAWGMDSPSPFSPEKWTA